MSDPGSARGAGDLLGRLEQLNQIGIALSKERDITKLLEVILVAAKDVTHADGGTLYRMTEEKTLKFEIIRNDTLGIAIHEMLFIGDALFPGGNDYPAKEAGVVSIQVKDPHETKRVIEAIVACLDCVQPTKLRAEESR